MAGWVTDQLINWFTKEARREREQANDMNEQGDTKMEEKLEAVADFLSYEEYLDSQILPMDEYFLEDKELARELVQLGYRGGSQADTISREEFAQLKQIQNDKKSFQKEAPKLLVRCCPHFCLCLFPAIATGCGIGIR